MEHREQTEELLERARQTLAEAEVLIREGFLHGAVNRLYYACFYAVSALLRSENRFSSKHSGVIARFDQYWIKPGRLPVEMGRFYRSLFELRQQGDYANVLLVSREQTEQILEQSRSFIDSVENCLRENI